MDVQLINTVILAKNYKELVKWYEKVLELDIKYQDDKEYHYTDLAKNGKLVVGIGTAEKSREDDSISRNQSVFMQISVSDIYTLFDKVKSNNGKIINGPTRDKNHGFLFGGFEDIEGNQVWVIENYDFKSLNY